MTIDTFVTAIENRVNWRPLWASRLLGCTVGLLRLADWIIDSPNAEVCVGEDATGNLIFVRNRWRNRVRLAWTMWWGRYWYDWKVEA